MGISRDPAIRLSISQFFDVLATGLAGSFLYLKPTRGRIRLPSIFAASIFTFRLVLPRHVYSPEHRQYSTYVSKCALSQLTI